MIYLLKASCVLILFYLGYKLFLQKETFFQSNRWFLLTGLIIALIIPFIVIPVEVVKTAPLIAQFDVTNLATTNSHNGLSIGLEEILLGIYFIGIFIFLTKFLIQIGSLLVILLKSKIHKQPPYKFIKLDTKIPPFSFFNWIAFNPSQFKDTELDQIILHEKVHADQYHSIDILSIQLASIVFWFNPFIWLYKKDLEQNLEFIADQSTQEQSSCTKSYQYLLLKSSMPKYQLALANNFYNSLIKKRIVMLHKNRSNKKNQWKYTLMIPVLALFIMSFNTKEIVTYEPYDTYEEMSSESLYGDVEAIIITKTTSEDKLKEITQSLKEKGITVKFKGVKRNADGEITDISISAKTEKSSANISESNDEGISPIKLSIDGNSISIGNTNAWHHKEGNVVFFNKDGKHKIHKEGKGENVFFFKHDEDGEKHEHEEGEDHEHEYKYKVIEGDDDKIIIKSGAKVIDLKKHKDGNVFFYKGEGDHDVEIIHADSINWKEGQHKFNGNVIIKSDGDGKEENLYIIKKDGKGNVIKEWKEHDVDASEWKVKKGKSFSIRTLGKDKNKIFISSSDSDKEPLVILDGEEITRKEMEKMDSNNIEKVEVLKGESATKKYGDKGKDGVILITSKKKKD